MLITTRSALRAHDACEDRYAYLCTWAPDGDEAPIPLEDILQNNGIEDAIWALYALDDDGGLARWIARWVAAQIAYLWNPPSVVRRWLRTGDEAIRIAARSAACAEDRPESRAAVGFASRLECTSTILYALWYASWAEVSSELSAARSVAVRIAVGHKLAWAIAQVRAGKPLPQIRIPTSAKTAWK